MSQGDHILPEPVDRIIWALRKKVPGTYGGTQAMNDGADALEKAKFLLDFYAHHPSLQGTAMNRRVREWLGLTK